MVLIDAAVFQKPHDILLSRSIILSRENKH